MKATPCYRCQKKGIKSYYEYEETREGGYDGALSSLVRGHYHFYRCTECGALMAESSALPIRVVPTDA